MRALKYGIIILVLLTIGFFSIGFIKPTVEFQTKVTAEKPLEYSFAIFSNPMFISDWMTGLKSIAYVSGVPYQVGNQWELTMEYEGEKFVFIQEITGFEMYKNFQFTLRNDQLHIDVRIDFEETDGKTTITTTNTIRCKNILWRSYFPFIIDDIQKSSQEEYDNLKALIEK